MTTSKMNSEKKEKSETNFKENTLKSKETSKDRLTETSNGSKDLKKLNEKLRKLETEVEKLRDQSWDFLLIDINLIGQKLGEGNREIRTISDEFEKDLDVIRKTIYDQGYPDALDKAIDLLHVNYRTMQHMLILHEAIKLSNHRMTEKIRKKKGKQ